MAYMILISLHTITELAVYNYLIFSGAPIFNACLALRVA